MNTTGVVLRSLRPAKFRPCNSLRKVQRCSVGCSDNLQLVQEHAEVKGFALTQVTFGCQCWSWPSATCTVDLFLESTSVYVYWWS